MSLIVNEIVSFISLLIYCDGGVKYLSKTFKMWLFSISLLLPSLFVFNQSNLIALVSLMSYEKKIFEVRTLHNTRVVHTYCQLPSFQSLFRFAVERLIILIIYLINIYLSIYLLLSLRFSFVNCCKVRETQLDNSEAIFNRSMKFNPCGMIIGYHE